MLQKQNMPAHARRPQKRLIFIRRIRRESSFWQRVFRMPRAVSGIIEREELQRSPAAGFQPFPLSAERIAIVMIAHSSGKKAGRSECAKRSNASSLIAGDRGDILCGLCARWQRNPPLLVLICS